MHSNATNTPKLLYQVNGEMVFFFYPSFIFIQHRTWNLLTATSIGEICDAIQIIHLDDFVTSGNALPFPVHLQLRQETGDGVRSNMFVVSPPRIVVCRGKPSNDNIIIIYYII